MINFTLSIVDNQVINGITYTQAQLSQGLAQIRTQHNQRTGESLTDSEWLQWAHLQNLAAWYEQNKAIEAVEPNPIVTAIRSIDARRLRLALFQLGYLDAVNAAVLAAGDSAVIDWEYAEIIKANHPLAISLNAVFGWNIDAIIDLAETFI